MRVVARAHPALVDLNLWGSWGAHVLAASALLLALAFRIWVKVEKTDLGYELARERNSTIQLDMDRRELELQLSVVKRPDHLRKEAKRLNLQPLSPSQAVRLKTARGGS